MSELDGTVAVVTGATGGMGQEIALELARRGARIVTVARDEARAGPLRARIEEEAGPGRLDVVRGDLTRRDDLVEAAARIASRYEAVHLLVNNAGAHFPDRRLSADGIELHVALDYLAAYGMTALLEAPLRLGRARVVHVVSDTVNDTRSVKLSRRRRPPTLDAAQLKDLRLLNPADGFVPFEAYARAKLLTVMAGYSSARRLADDGVRVDSVHPGIVATGIIDDLVPAALRPARGLIRRLMLTPEEGAAAALRVALDPSSASGRYLRRETVASTPSVSFDRSAQDALEAVSAAHFGL